MKERKKRGLGFPDLPPPSVGTTLSGENSLPPPAFFSSCPLSHAAMVGKKKNIVRRWLCPLSLMRSARILAMAKLKNKSISLIDIPNFDVPATGSLIPVMNFSLVALASASGPSSSAQASASGSSSVVASVAAPVPLESSKDGVPSFLNSSLPPQVEGSNLREGFPVATNVSKPLEKVDAQVKNYAVLLKCSAQLQEMGTPIDHISGAPFVLIPDENIEAAKMEFKYFIYARFHGDYPSMGKIIGVVNAVWARTGPRIFVHNLGQGTYLLRVTNPRTREVFLSRTCWNIGGLPMFVAPWSPEYSPDEPPLTSAIVPVEMRNVPYLLFNREILSRIATAIGKPESLAPKTERKENFEVAKLYVRVDLTSPLPHKVVSRFSNGKEVMIDVSYPWLPIKCDSCSKFVHIKERCPTARDRMLAHQTSGRRSKSRSGRSYDKKSKNLETCYVPIVRDTNCGTEPQENDTVSPKAQESCALEEGEIYQETEDHEADADKCDRVVQDTAHGGVSNTGEDSRGSADVVVSDQQSVKDRRGDLQDVISDRVAVEVISSESLSEAVPAAVVELITEALVSNVDPGGSANLDSDQDVAKQEGTERQDTAPTLEDQDRDNPFILDVSGRIIIVWDPTVTMCIYHATAQSVTCGATILSENITLTVTFVYGFNQVEERSALWDSLVELQDTSPFASHPWSVIGDFNQMLRTNHHSNHLFSRVDEAGMDDANLGLQEAQLFEAQTKGPPYTWRNMQDDNPISTKIDHAFINQAWSSAFPDSYAEFLDPSQSDHGPCLLRMPSIRRRVVKPFKFFHHVIDHPEYAETFKLVRLLKKLKRPLRSLNKRHFSGISQRVKGQKEKVDALQRALLTSPDNATAAEEHVERDNFTDKGLEFVGDRNTPFYHRTVSQHASRNHIHYLKDTDDRMLFSMDDIKAHAANYFQGILGST
ncbi:LOW QUALITY PROTEIN: hypothetical protein HID58_087962, partial [Brassica napus]